jgi:hypothetical protein
MFGLLLANMQVPMLIGTLIIEYAMSDYHSGSQLYLGNKLDLVGCSKLDVSWDNHLGTTVSLFVKRESEYTGNYYDWSDYGELLRKRLKSIRMMINQYLNDDDNSNILYGPLTITMNENGENTNMDIMSELLTLEVIEREDRYILSNEVYRNRIMQLYSTVLFNWYIHSSNVDTFRDTKIAVESDDNVDSNKDVGGNLSKDVIKENNKNNKLILQFSKNELNYLKTFAMLSGNEFNAYNFNGEWVGNRMSAYSYSHKFDTSNKNVIISNRIRIGTTINFSKLWDAAKLIMNDKNISLDEDIVNDLDSNNGHGNIYSFHALGWDGGVNGTDDDNYAFKIFIMYHDFDQISTKYSNLARKGAQQLSKFCLQNGLLSFVYNNNNKLIENRLIMYPKEVNDVRAAGLDVPSHTGTAALMFTDSERELM